MRRTALAATVAVLAGVPATIGLASPAQAYATPTFSTADVSTPGHAKVTVTTDAPYVVAWLRSTTLSVRVTEPLFLPTANGEASFDLETWGVDSAQVMARACTDATVGSCDPIELSGTFIPSTVDPVITWPADDTVGAADVYTPDVADPDGGGLLVADWMGVRTVLSPGTPVTLPLATEGAGSISVLRCSALASSVCAPSGLTHAIEVNRVLSAGGQVSTPYVNPDNASVKAHLWVTEGLTQLFTFEWHVTTPAGDVVPDVGGVIDNLSANSNGDITTQVAVPGLPDGKFTLRGHLSYADPEFGEVGRNLSIGTFTLDRLPPDAGSTTFSSRSLYPFIDGFQDQVLVRITDAENYTTARVRITDADGQQIRLMSKPVSTGHANFEWGGKDASGNVVAAGVYTVTSSAVDLAGNESAPVTWTVTVVRERLERITFDHTYTAAQTLTQVHVGSCSAVVKPSSYPWKGSIELRSDSKCNGSGAPAVAETIHSVSLPAGTYVSGGVTLSVYGASTVDRMSDASLFARNGSGSWRAPVTLDQHLEWHPVDLNQVGQLLGAAHRLTWRVRVDRGQSKYALGLFKVHFFGGYLVAE